MVSHIVVYKSFYDRLSGLMYVVVFVQKITGCTP